MTFWCLPSVHLTGLGNCVKCHHAAQEDTLVSAILSVVNLFYINGLVVLLWKKKFDCVIMTLL